GAAGGPARAMGRAAAEGAPGGSGWVQLYRSQPLAVAPGDRFVLRLPSPSITIAGGAFADVNPRRHPRHDERVPESLERRVAGEVLQEELRKYPRGITEAALLRATLAEASDASRLQARS